MFHFKKNHFAQRGFTLIELVAIIILLVIIVAFAVSRWPGATIDLNAQTQQLMSDIRYTQSLAMTHGKRYRINFVTLSSSYNITDTSGTAIPNPGTGANSVTLGSGMSFGGFTNLPNNLLAFDEAGTPYSDATATTALAANASIPLTNGANTQTIQVTVGTGRTIIQ